ncbi:TPA: pentapeptide repeat-containing protein [Campylobacter coli]|nr:pentapeptide repeat-containing protein [Campylobacter coli]
MEEFDKKLAQYGILAKNGKQDIKDDKITIINAEIKEINFQTLQEAGIKEICISRSEIKYLYFLEKNTIKIDFKVCNFKNHIIARKAYFENEVIFQQCIFDAVVDFSKAEFDSRIDFSASVFKEEVRFIETQFQAEQSNNETIENDFGEVIFEGKAIFDNATFQARVSFTLSHFKDEARFVKTEFQAEQSNNETIENDFREVIFEGRVSFFKATFKARVCFGLSQFKSEANFITTEFQANQNDSDIIENQFLGVVFIGKTIFNHATFKARVSFGLSQFKEEVRFIETQFLAEQNNSKIIENDFREVICEGRASFSNATFQARVSFGLSQFKSEANFTNTKFQANQNDSNIIEKQNDNETIENDFREVIFEGRTSFSNATFQARVCFALSQFKDEVRFIGTQLLAKQSSNLEIIENEFRETIFKEKVTFGSLVLKARISFSFSIFKDEALFLNINPNNFTFHNVEFNKINFIHIDDINAESNAESYVFQNTVFKDALSFEGMEFERLEFDNVLFNGVVTFSNTKLNTKPQFINCTFSNQFNIEHQYIKYSDKDIENKINNIQDKNDKFRALLNLRDLFRKLKSNRIAHHNLIDASGLRTQELYTRELELKYKEKKSLRETIERWQLFFYHKLCDHHTDLLKAFHNLLIVVMLFGIFSFALDKFKQPNHIENDIKYNIVKVDSNENYIFKEHNKTTYNLLSLNIEQESDKFIKNDFVYMIVFLILVLLLLSFNIFTSIYIFGSILYLIFSFLDLLALYTHIAVIVFFVLFALKFILLDDRQRYKRGIVVAISYTVCIFTLLVKPSLLLPALGSFLDKDSNATYPLLLSLSVVYFMFAVLILFSLQKTARKNSIVPS